MNARRGVLLGIVLAGLAPLSSCDWLFGSNGCRDAQEHYCSRLPGFGCSDSQMTNAVNRVIEECGRDKAEAFFSRAIGRCEREGADMECPID